MKKLIFISILSVLLLLTACTDKTLNYYDMAPLDESTEPPTLLI